MNVCSFNDHFATKVPPVSQPKLFPCFIGGLGGRSEVNLYKMCQLDPGSWRSGSHDPSHLAAHKFSFNARPCCDISAFPTQSSPWEVFQSPQQTEQKSSKWIVLTNNSFADSNNPVFKIKTESNLDWLAQIQNQFLAPLSQYGQLNIDMAAIGIALNCGI